MTNLLFYPTDCIEISRSVTKLKNHKAAGLGVPTAEILN